MSATTTHHPDCDGWRTAHRVYIVTDRDMSRAVCEQCGPLHLGSYGPSVNVERMYGGHSQEVPCDGRCMEWAD